MKEKDPESSSYAPDADVVVGINTMIAAGAVAAWLEMIEAVRPAALQRVLGAAGDSDSPRAAADLVYTRLRERRDLKRIDFSRDVHARLPAPFRHYALHHDVPWDDKGMLKQLREGPGGLYFAGENISAEACEDVSAVIPADVKRTDLHLIGLRSASVVVRCEGGLTVVYIVGDGATGRDIKRHLSGPE
jgi:hypothetical protein